ACRRDIGKYAPVARYGTESRRGAGVTGWGHTCGMGLSVSDVFVGRAEELDRLLAVLARAEQGRPAVGLVAGDAGVGKTRLLQELAVRAEARGARVLVGGCMEAGDVGLPYVPFVDAFRDVGGHPGEAALAAPVVAAVP